MKKKVVNFFGGPGTGKSTVASALFFMLKSTGFQIELVTEFAKELTWEGRKFILDEQFIVSAEQYRRLITPKVPVITDSPLLLGRFYNDNSLLNAYLEDLFHDKFDNFNIYLQRDISTKYNEEGRNEKLEEAVRIDKEILQFLKDSYLPFVYSTDPSYTAKVVDFLNAD